MLHLQPVDCYVITRWSWALLSDFPAWPASSVHRRLTRVLCRLPPTGDPDSETFVVFVPYLLVHVFPHLVDIYRLPVLPAFEDLSGRAWHLSPLCVWGLLPSYLVGTEGGAQARECGEELAAVGGGAPPFHSSFPLLST